MGRDLDKIHTICKNLFNTCHSYYDETSDFESSTKGNKFDFSRCIEMLLDGIGKNGLYSYLYEVCLENNFIVGFYKDINEVISDVYAVISNKLDELLSYHYSNPMLSVLIFVYCHQLGYTKLGLLLANKILFEEGIGLFSLSCFPNYESFKKVMDMGVFYSSNFLVKHCISVSFLDDVVRLGYCKECSRKADITKGMYMSHSDVSYDLLLKFIDDSKNSRISLYLDGNWVLDTHDDFCYILAENEGYRKDYVVSGYDCTVCICNQCTNDSCTLRGGVRNPDSNSYFCDECKFLSYYKKYGRCDRVNRILY